MIKVIRLLLLSTGLLRAELTLAPVFNDHMVLQRDQELPVWGQAAQGVQVTVEFSSERRSTTAGPDGRCLIRLNPHAASAESRSLQVSAAGESLEFKDVLVGEVWLCAGQSNMEWPLSKEMHAEVELVHASHPLIRMFNPGYAGQDAGGNPFSAEDVVRLTPRAFYSGAWEVCTPVSAARVSAIGYYFARDLQAALNVPIGIIHLAVGGSPTEAWMRRELLAGEPVLRPLTDGDWLANPALEAWCRLRGHENLDRALATGPVVPDSNHGGGPNHPFKPGFLWSAAIEPLAPFALRGVLWYQGESNSLNPDRVRQHETLFPLLVRDWRAHWQLGEFPFLYYQLSGIEAKPYHSEYWPDFRDSQRRLLKVVPNAGMVVTADVGDRASVHPRDKKTVGVRMARLALAQTYGFDLEASGPQPRSAVVRENKIIVSFSHVVGGLRTSDGQPPHSFEIAAADGQFIPAQGMIAGATVALTFQPDMIPRRVRYGWQPFPEGNLINNVALPTTTFLLEVSGGK